MKQNGSAAFPSNMHCWSLEFNRSRSPASSGFVLTICDETTRQLLAELSCVSPSASLVVRELDALVGKHGRPTICLSDHSDAFTDKAVQGWAENFGVEWLYLPGGNPARKSLIERTVR